MNGIKDKVRVNERIKAPMVRVIDSDGTQLGIMSSLEALARAKDYNLDLVEVSPKADPPVCKIMDYGKYKYLQSKKAHEAKKKQTIIQIKEIKLRPRTDKHDIEFKVKHIRKFLEDGAKTKVTIFFRGRERTHPDIGRGVLERVYDMVKDIAVIEQEPKMEGRNMFMILSSKKE